MVVLLALVCFYYGFKTMTKNPIVGIIICGIGAGLLQAIAD